MRALHSLLVALVSTTVATSALGTQPQAQATADALFRSGKDAVARGDLVRGCAQLAESQRLDPAVGTLLNLADCEEKAGKLGAALGHFQTARDQMPPGDFRIAFAGDAIQRVNARVPRLTLRVPPSLQGAQVTLDGVALGPPSFGVPLPVDPGPHSCALVVPGHAETRREVTASEGQTQIVELAPGDAIPAPAEPSRTQTPSSDDAGGWRTAGFVAGAVGVVGLGVGTVTGVMTIAEASTYHDQCHNGSCTAQGLDAASTGRVTQWVSPIGLAAGVVGLGFASYALFLRPHPATTVAIAPAVGPTSAAVSVFGAF